ncbi:MAG: SGNH/GDSL hydrolase family protein [Thermonemataceae bacterium]|nr:SGNH/GDSL hydrolase family protein [Thermonemataceae bacterium]
MGGATTGTYNINEPLKDLLQLEKSIELSGMLAQVQTYLSSSPKIDEKTLFVLWAGGHDIGNYLEYGQPDLEQYLPAENYRTAIVELVKAGAKHIFVGTMPDMGYTPMYIGTKKQEIASKLCQDLNKGLEEIEKSYQDSEVNFYRFDGAGVFVKIGLNLQEYGIQYTEPYLPYEIIDFTKPLETNKIVILNKEKGLNPDEFMNWWAVSASAKVHEILAKEAVKFINSKEKI